ncbi:hypothetical protein [Bradyrhizobium sp. INPA03-11B]|uniref:hypothetical protein n=1 Tax=Bradyrhizobium sp. INPA03-11B TaxID=418598 RepID=UPI00338E4C88
MRNSTHDFGSDKSGERVVPPTKRDIYMERISLAERHVLDQQAQHARHNLIQGTADVVQEGCVQGVSTRSVRLV